MKTNRTVALTALSCAAALALASPAQAASGLQKFGTGTVTVVGSSVTIVNGDGQYGGVYVKGKSSSSKALSGLDFSFRNTGDVAGGAPRFSLPIDSDLNSGTNNGYAFIDVNGCGGDPVVSTNNAACTVYFGPDAYANWDALTAAHPTWRLAPGSSPFVIADVAGSYAVTDVSLRQ
jgi:hypothetical protein